MHENRVTYIFWEFVFLLQSQGEDLAVNEWHRYFPEAIYVLIIIVTVYIPI